MFTYDVLYTYDVDSSMWRATIHAGERRVTVGSHTHYAHMALAVQKAIALQWRKDMNLPPSGVPRKE